MTSRAEYDAVDCGGGGGTGGPGGGGDAFSGTAAPRRPGPITAVRGRWRVTGGTIAAADAARPAAAHRTAHRSAHRSVHRLGSPPEARPAA
ncbi:hypothetical protein ACFU6R_27375 [Streptomyces sp. NPDC057499]|uniref:hypothetical protein n=1 Tax=Streptomyces sp. NPDC057499 TaxID=3346150 RepID=UPI0036B6B326